MKKIYAQNRIKKALDNSIYKEMLDFIQVPLFLMEYDPGEIIAAPWCEPPYFQIVSSGSLSIYYIRDDGSRYSLSSGGANYIIGEMNLFTGAKDNVYAEASDRLVTIAADSRLYRDRLLNNLCFLRFIASVMADKITVITKMDASTSTLSERIMNYIRFKCENQTLRGVEKTAFALHCSPRQLQRLLNELEQQGLIQKIGKGSYQIRETVFPVSRSLSATSKAPSPAPAHRQSAPASDI